MTDVHDKTRAIYHAQHDRLRSDEAARKRIHSMYTEEYFGLGPNWFRGKRAADIGCGNTAVLAIRLASFGAAHVTLGDLGDAWMPAAREEMRREKIDESRFVMREGNVLRLVLPQSSFDFVACNGVLCHLANIAEVEEGFARVGELCKSGGWYYTTYGTAGGMVEGAIFPYLRERYRSDPELKELIDTITPATISALLKLISREMEQHTAEQWDPEPIARLFGEDFCVFLQNVSQPPQRLMLECSPSFVESLYRKHGFTDVRRLRRYVRRMDVRRFLAPLHYNKQLPLSRLLYGEGSVEYIARRR